MYPALIPVDRVTRAPGKPYHTLINADNFHALQVLLYCYEGAGGRHLHRSAVQHRGARLEVQQRLRRQRTISTATASGCR